MAKYKVTDDGMGGYWMYFEDAGSDEDADNMARDLLDGGCSAVRVVCDDQTAYTLIVEDVEGDLTCKRIDY